VTVKSATIANYAVTAELEIPEGPDANTVFPNRNWHADLALKLNLLMAGVNPTYCLGLKF
jgi:hypothetical protein